jgi:N-acetylglucosaminyldiphosphoundecaprenol N-acetyl-beta-D-mannosaminyltransferase
LYYPKKINKKVLNKIKKSNPSILCFFAGAPFQETWYNTNREELGKLGVGAGVSLGGTAKFLSGRTKRAPEFYKRNHLEWIYRLISEKGRFKRFISRIPLFSLLVIQEILFSQ